MISTSGGIWVGLHNFLWGEAQGVSDGWGYIWGIFGVILMEGRR